MHDWFSIADQQLQTSSSVAMVSTDAVNEPVYIDVGACQAVYESTEVWENRTVLCHVCCIHQQLAALYAGL